VRPPRSFAALALGIAMAACSGSNGSSRVTTPSNPRAAVGATTTTAAPSAGCDRQTVPAPGVSERTFTSRGVERMYQLTIPEHYDGTKPLPIVLGLHALTVSHLFVAGMIGFGDMSSRYDFIGVAPSGRLDGSTPFWLAAPSNDNYDVDFIAELLDRLEAQLCVDRARVFSTGMSNGAQMSSLLACRLPDRITAVAPVAGVEFADTCNDGPVGVIAFHGRADPIVSYDGGGLNATRISDVQYWKGAVPDGLPVHHGVDAAMRTWAAHNRCDAEPIVEHVTKNVEHRTWQHCDAPTELYAIAGTGHAWPGKPVPAFEPTFGPGTTEIDASTLIFDFFFARAT
jgi:polyhydroxybutyrate depolymerase